MRQHAVAALNLVQQAKRVAVEGESADPAANTALIDGVRKFAMDVRELDIDLIDRINPFSEAYAILAKTMSEDRLETGRPRPFRPSEPISRPTKRRILPFARCDSRRNAVGFHRSPRPTPGKSCWPKAQPPSCASRMRAAMSEIDLDKLSEELAEFAQPPKTGRRSPREERIIAGFEDIQRFVEQHGHSPHYGEDRDIFERLYAVRLARLRALEECRVVLAPFDCQGLLSGAEVVPAELAESITDDEMLARLEDVAGTSAITGELRHVRPGLRCERRMKSRIAKCADFTIDVLSCIFSYDHGRGS